MGLAKTIIVNPISSGDARKLIKRLHYSGKVVNNSVLHLGVFINERLEGALQFGSPLDKRKVLGLVEGTRWGGMLELNRMAFSDRLPRNSESRAISVAMRLIRKEYPHIEWVLSFADATQCGDGTIYRASGFNLIGVKRNNSIWKAPGDRVFTDVGLRTGKSEMKAAKKIISRTTVTKSKHMENGAASMKQYIEAGFEPLEGYQLRYIYFLNKQAKDRLTVSVLPFSKIDEMGAGMYKGQKRTKHAMTGTTGTAAGKHRPVRSNIEAGEWVG